MKSKNSTILIGVIQILTSVFILGWIFSIWSAHLVMSTLYCVAGPCFPIKMSKNQQCYARHPQSRFRSFTVGIYLKACDYCLRCLSGGGSSFTKNRRKDGIHCPNDHNYQITSCIICMLGTLGPCALAVEVSNHELEYLTRFYSRYYVLLLNVCPQDFCDSIELRRSGALLKLRTNLRVT
jgi:hypothetical protein